MQIGNSTQPLNCVTLNDLERLQTRLSRSRCKLLTFCRITIAIACCVKRLTELTADGDATAVERAVFQAKTSGWRAAAGRQRGVLIQTHRAGMMYTATAGDAKQSLLEAGEERGTCRRDTA